VRGGLEWVCIDTQIVKNL